MIDRGERRSGAWRGLATNTQRCSTPSRSRFSSSRARPALCVRVVTGRLQGLRQHHHLQRHQHAWGSTLRVGTGKGFALRPSKAGGDPGRVGAQPIPALHSGEFALHAGEFAGTSLRVTGALTALQVAGSTRPPAALTLAAAGAPLTFARPLHHQEAPEIPPRPRPLQLQRQLQRQQQLSQPLPLSGPQRPRSACRSRRAIGAGATGTGGGGGDEACREERGGAQAGIAEAGRRGFGGRGDALADAGVGGSSGKPFTTGLHLQR